MPADFLTRVDTRVAHEFGINRRTRLLVHRVIDHYRRDRQRIAAVRDLIRRHEAYAEHLREVAPDTHETRLRAAYAEKAARDLRKALS